jgi:RNA polymerase sigma-70 factor (sigma-E family)
MPESDVDGGGFSDFMTGALPGLLRFGYVLTGSPDEAEDLVQEALARCLRRWRRVRADNPGAYVRRVMINAHVDRWRRWGAQVQLGEVPDIIGEDAGIQRREDWDTLRAALAKLPSRQRAVLVLRYFEDLPDASIAALLGLRPGTVRSQSSRGLAALRPLLMAGTTGRAGGGDAHAR